MRTAAGGLTANVVNGGALGCNHAGGAGDGVGGGVVRPPSLEVGGDVRMPITRSAFGGKRVAGQGYTGGFSHDLSYRICDAAMFTAAIRGVMGSCGVRFWGHGMQYLHYRYLFKGMLGARRAGRVPGHGGAHPHTYSGSDSL